MLEKILHGKQLLAIILRADCREVDALQGSAGALGRAARARSQAGCRPAERDWKVTWVPQAI
jgi:hypothetical protein